MIWESPDESGFQGSGISWTASIPSKGDRYDPYRRTPFPDHCPHSGHLDPDFAAIVELRRCHLPNRDRPYWAEWHLPFRQLTPRPAILPGAGTGRRAACRCSLWVKDGLAIQLAIADIFGVNSIESKREQSGIIRGEI